MAGKSTGLPWEIAVFRRKFLQAKESGRMDGLDVACQPLPKHCQHPAKTLPTLCQNTAKCEPHGRLAWRQSFG